MLNAFAGSSTRHSGSRSCSMFAARCPHLASRIACAALIDVQKRYAPDPAVFAANPESAPYVRAPGGHFVIVTGL